MNRISVTVSEWIQTNAPMTQRNWIHLIQLCYGILQGNKITQILPRNTVSSTQMENYCLEVNKVSPSDSVALHSFYKLLVYLALAPQVWSTRRYH